MSHHYLEWARRISMDVIGSLADDDLIHVLTFDSVIEVLGPTEHGFIRATRPVKKALQEQLLKITARGGTNLTEAIQAGGAALALLNDLEDTEAIDRVALLISDGAYGDEASAVYHRENDLGGSRVISVAIGENANGFLEQLSANGVCVYVSSEAGLSEASDKVMSRVATAAYSKAQLLASGLTQQAPRHAPDIYPDVLVTLSGRMPRPKEGESVEVIALGEHVVTLPIAISQDSSTTTRWASQYIKSLDYGMMSTDFSAMGIEHHDSLEAQIVAMSIKYRVLSKYTAWLAVDRSRSTDQVIVRTVPSFPVEELIAPLLQVSYSFTASFDAMAIEDNHDPRTMHKTRLSTLPILSPNLLESLRETFGQSVLDSSPSRIRFPRLMKLIRFLMSLFRRRKKLNRRR
jgi:Ca-activated chloride channel family protein